MYYKINEDEARLAHNLNSFGEYKENEVTLEYQKMVDKAVKIAREQKERFPDESEKIDGLLDKYSRLLADWFNKNSHIEASCPSILISGGGNFPVAKKEKQNSRRDSHMHAYEDVQNILKKIKSVGTGGIKSNDKRAIEKLKSKLKQLEDNQEFMKAVNAYYRKHKTVHGCPFLTESQINAINLGIERSFRENPKPFESYSLTNNNANIRRLKKRVEELEKVKTSETSEKTFESLEGVKVIENTEFVRIQIVFDGKPSEQVRNVLKTNGFRWSPKFGVWQRQLNDNGRYATKVVLDELNNFDSLF